MKTVVINASKLTPALLALINGLEQMDGRYQVIPGVAQGFQEVPMPWDATMELVEVENMPIVLLIEGGIAPGGGYPGASCSVTVPLTGGAEFYQIEVQAFGDAQIPAELIPVADVETVSQRDEA